MIMKRGVWILSLLIIFNFNFAVRLNFIAQIKDSVVVGAVEKNNNVFLFTSSGIYKFNLKNRKLKKFLSYEVLDFWNEKGIYFETLEAVYKFSFDGKVARLKGENFIDFISDDLIVDSKKLITNKQIFDLSVLNLKKVYFALKDDQHIYLFSDRGIWDVDLKLRLINKILDKVFIKKINIGKLHTNFVFDRQNKIYIFKGINDINKFLDGEFLFLGLGVRKSFIVQDKFFNLIYVNKNIRQILFKLDSKVIFSSKLEDGQLDRIFLFLENGKICEYHELRDSKAQKAFELYVEAKKLYEEYKLKEAIKKMEEAVKLVENSDYYYLLGQLYLKIGDLNKAIFVLSKIKGIRAKKLLAIAYYQAGKLSKAFATYKDLFEKNLLTYNEKKNFISISDYLGKYGYSVKICMDLVEAGNKDKEIWNLLLKDLLILGRFTSYFSYVEKYKKIFVADPDYYYLKGLYYYYANRNLKKAAEMFNKAFNSAYKKDPKYMKWYFFVNLCMGKTKFEDKRLNGILEYEILKAIEYMKKKLALKYMEKLIMTPLPGYYYFIQGRLAEIDKKYDTALNLYNVARKKNMFGPYVIYRIAEVLRKKEYYEEALSYYQIALDKCKYCDIRKKIENKIKMLSTPMNTKQNAPSNVDKVEDIKDVEKLLDSIGD